MVTANLNVPLMVGQTGYTLTCGVTRTDNYNLMIIITYQWTRDNGSTSTQVGTNSTTLHFSPLQLSDAGNYSCSVTSNLLTNPVIADNSQRVTIQSKYSYYYFCVARAPIVCSTCSSRSTICYYH